MWEMEPETQSYLVKAVVGLLQEAKPFGSRFGSEQEEAHRRTMQVCIPLDLTLAFGLSIRNYIITATF